MLRFIASAWLTVLLAIGMLRAFIGYTPKGSTDLSEFTLGIIAVALVDLMFTLRRIEKRDTPQKDRASA